MKKLLIATLALGISSQVKSEILPEGVAHNQTSPTTEGSTNKLTQVNENSEHNSIADEQIPVEAQTANASLNTTTSTNTIATPQNKEVDLNPEEFELDEDIFETTNQEI